MTLVVKTPVTSGSNTTVSSITFTTVSDYVSGDLLIAIIAFELSNSAATVSVPTGFTAIDQDTTGAIRSMFIQKVAATESNFSISPSAGNFLAGNCTIFAVSGYDTGTTISAHSTQADGSSTTSHVSASITPTHDSSLVVMAATGNTDNNSVGTITGNSPFTLQGNRLDTNSSSRAWHGIQTDIQVTAGAITGTITTVNASQGQTYIASINPGITTSSRTISSTSGLKATLSRTVSSTLGLKATLARIVNSTTILKSTVARTVQSTSLLTLRFVRTISSTSGFKATLARTISSTTIFQGSLQRTVQSTTLFAYHELTPLLSPMVTDGLTTTNQLGAAMAAMDSANPTKARFS